MSNQKKILITALNWGLGHATRCVPLINYLLANNIDVYLASDGKSYSYLKSEFPNITLFVLPSYDVQYHANQKTWLQLAKQLPHIKKTIKAEQIEISKLVKQHKFDVIISDNRYGCFHHSTRNILLTHQLNIQIPGALWWTSVLVQKKLNSYINNFDECWIPDLPNAQNSLSGNLSHPAKLEIPVHYIGWLSRFSDVKKSNTAFDHDILAIVSGPEPQKTILKELIIKQAINLSKKTLIISGDPDESFSDESGNVKMVSHLSSADFAAAISKADVVISRPGYSTLMDLSCFGKKVIFTPTPGQTEQEYLAERIGKPNSAYVINQRQLSIADALHNLSKYEGVPAIDHHTDYRQYIDKIIEAK